MACADWAAEKHMPVLSCRSHCQITGLAKIDQRLGRILILNGGNGNGVLILAFSTWDSVLASIILKAAKNVVAIIRLTNMNIRFGCMVISPFLI
jgi:hypothetical protein